MNRYEAKLEARRERLEARAAANRAEAERRIHEATREGALPPWGEPIKVGHHSERKHRAAIARSDMNMRKGVEASDKANHYERAAAGVGAAGISSDDPDAIAKLRQELQQLEQSQVDMNRWNAQFRKGGIEAIDAPEETKASTRHMLKLCPYIRKPFSTENNGANIRRVKARIADLEKAGSRETVEIVHSSGVRLVENVEDNRVQLFFDGKPADDVRARLKQNGFRWSPMAGAWQRHLNNAGRYAAKYVLETLSGDAS